MAETAGLGDVARLTPTPTPVAPGAPEPDPTVSVALGDWASTGKLGTRYASSHPAAMSARSGR